jgi:hypothetical protein
MATKRKIIVGDVHGCLDETKELLDRVKYDPAQDELFFVGDLINKGPHSYEVLKFVRGLGVTVIKGNHERKFLKYLRLEDPPFRRPHFDELRDKLGDEIEDWKVWIKNLPLYYEDDDVIIVHAGLQPGVHPKDTKARILTNIRTWDGKGERLDKKKNPAWYDLYTGEKLVVFGHWAKRGLTVRPNAIGLDTGCAYGGELTAVILPGRALISVPAKQVYFDSSDDE